MQQPTLAVWADSGYIYEQPNGKDYLYYIITKEIYPSDVAEHELDINLPMKGNRKFYFRGNKAIEPISFDVIEVSIKTKDGIISKIDTKEIFNNSNLNNDDLSTYFNSNKTHASKLKREKKLKDKKEKVK
jgi:hypothetical protein